MDMNVDPVLEAKAERRAAAEKEKAKKETLLLFETLTLQRLKEHNAKASYRAEELATREKSNKQSSLLKLEPTYFQVALQKVEEYYSSLPFVFYCRTSILISKFLCIGGI